MGDAERHVVGQDDLQRTYGNRGVAGLVLIATHFEELAFVGEVAVCIEVDVGREAAVGQAAAVGVAPRKGEARAARGVDGRGHYVEERGGHLRGGINLHGRAAVLRDGHLHEVLLIVLNVVAVGPVLRHGAPLVDGKVRGELRRFLAVVSIGVLRGNNIACGICPLQEVVARGGRGLDGNGIGGVDGQFRCALYGNRALGGIGRGNGHLARGGDVVAQEKGEGELRAVGQRDLRFHRARGRGGGNVEGGRSNGFVGGYHAVAVEVDAEGSDLRSDVFRENGRKGLATVGREGGFGRKVGGKPERQVEDGACGIGNRAEIFCKEFGSHGEGIAFRLGGILLCIVFSPCFLKGKPFGG